MDREIPKEIVTKRRRKVLITLVIVLIVIAIIIVGIFRTLTPSVSLKNLLLSTADFGPVENSFITNGIVEPFYQEMLTASLSSDILEIKKHPGEIVKPGDTIVVPDITELRRLENNIDHEIALKQNRIKRSREELRSKRVQLLSNLKKDSISIGHLSASLKKEEYLQEIGGGSQQRVDEAKINFQLASIQREEQMNEFESFKKLQKLDLESMELELELKYQQREKILSRINKACVQSKIRGVLTSVLVEPGQHVSEGQAIAHVADAYKFKIAGTISSRYANKIYAGQDAMIIINDTVLKGHLIAISPSVTNGSINYTVHLEQTDHSMLRAKLQVEVRLVLSVIPGTVRIANGDYYYGPGSIDVFVKNGDVLEKRKVKLGGANFDYVEVVSGISQGEIVVISNNFIQKHLRYNTLSCVE